MNLKDETRELAKRTQRIEIDYHDTEDYDKVFAAFSDHLLVTESATFGSPNSSKSAKQPKKLLTTIYSETFCDGDYVVCGLTNGELRRVDLSQLSKSVEESSVSSSKHAGLSCLRCSKANRNTFFSSSALDGVILLWDSRESSVKATQRFDLANNALIKGGGESLSRSLLSFDVSSNDQLVCGGTELKNEDSYLLFWDIRSSKLLGAYWESHSDDITAVRFHSTETHSLASGSTDGLINVYNLLETEEDDALLFSFNTESSVDSIHWNTGNASPLSASTLSSLTHTNDLHIWDTVSGDLIKKYTRSSIAESMMRSNPEAVHVYGCYQTEVGSTGLLASSLAGGCARLMDVGSTKLNPKSLFMDQSDAIQTAQYLVKHNRWITFDEKGCIKLWTSSLNQSLLQKEKVVSVSGVRNKRRYQPY